MEARQVLVVLIAATAIAAVAYLFFFAPKTMTMNAMDIAKSSINFLESKRRSDGLYTYSETCSDSGCKDDNFVYAQTNAWPVLAYTGLYEATDSKDYLAKAKAEMATLKSSCEKDRDQCLWVLVQMYRLYRATNEKAYADYIITLGERLYASQQSYHPMLTAIEAREFAIMYGLTNDTKYVTAAADRIEFAKRMQTSTSVETVKGTPTTVSNIAYSVDDFDFHYFACWTELAEIELYKRTGDERYAKSARDFFDKAQVGSHGREIEQMTGIEPCIDALSQLSILTKDESYKTQAINLTQYVVTYRWDSSADIAKKYNGNNGILFHRYTDLENFKTVTDTSYVVFLLSQIKDYEFKILRWR